MYVTECFLKLQIIQKYSLFSKGVPKTYCFFKRSNSYRKTTMPGHIKKADPNEKDPDPLPYLVVTLEMKRADAQIPYDPKKSYYCPDGKHGYMECILESLDGDKATVMCGHEVIKKQI